MNLHSFSNRGSDVCRSLFLRTFMVMMLFITGSNGIYAGEDLKATYPFSTPSPAGSWDGTENEYSWTKSTNNLMTIFTGLKEKLKTNYVALKFTTSNCTNAYRVCFMNGDHVEAQIGFWLSGDKNLDFFNQAELKNVDLWRTRQTLWCRLCRC